VFKRNLHPTHDRHISNPIFWMKCVDQQYTELKTKATHSLEDAAYDPLAEFFAIADRLIPDEMCKNKGYARSKADHAKYAEAVLGVSGLVAAPSCPVASVGVAAVSREDEHWQPWSGFHTMRPITRGPSAKAGSLVRNRFKFNDVDDARHTFEKTLRIKRITQEAVDASHLVSVPGCGGSEICELNEMFRGDDCCPSVLFGDDDSYDPFEFGFMHDNPDDLPDDEPLLIPSDALCGREVVECAEEIFWRSLDVNAVSISEKQAVQTLDLFAYNDDLGGVCDAITDITDGLLDGYFSVL